MGMPFARRWFRARSRMPNPLPARPRWARCWRFARFGRLGRLCVGRFAPGYDFLLCHKFSVGVELGKRSIHCVLRLVNDMMSDGSCQVLDSVCQLSFSEEFIYCLVTASEKVCDLPTVWDCRFCPIRWRAFASASDRVFVHSGQLRVCRTVRGALKVAGGIEAWNADKTP